MKLEKFSVTAAVVVQLRRRLNVNKAFAYLCWRSLPGPHILLEWNLHRPECEEGNVFLI